MSAAEPGDWVKVLAIVVDGAKHPDDTLVRFESHNEHFIGHIRDDMCEPAEAPSWQPRCPSLYKDDRDGGLIRQCEKRHEHSALHEARDPKWDLPASWADKDEYASVEL